ncbi:MAG: hypothetical protein JNJ54_01600 [Myxococcaceae bacterium]|nr:hypothetical protein [Myxococcaceae bacterium]
MSSLLEQLKDPSKGAIAARAADLHGARCGPLEGVLVCVAPDTPLAAQLPCAVP